MKFLSLKKSIFSNILNMNTIIKLKVLALNNP